MTDVLISVNDMTTQGALAAGIGHPKQYVTVHSGFELERFVDVGRQISITSAKERLGIPSEAPVVGKIARLFAQKGHEQFFEVASRIAQHNPEVRFLLVGDGPLRGALEEQVDGTKGRLRGSETSGRGGPGRPRLHQENLSCRRFPALPGGG